MKKDVQDKILNNLDPITKPMLKILLFISALVIQSVLLCQTNDWTLLKLKGKPQIISVNYENDPTGSYLIEFNPKGQIKTIKMNSKSGVFLFGEEGNVFNSDTLNGQMFRNSHKTGKLEISTQYEYSNTNLLRVFSSFPDKFIFYEIIVKYFQDSTIVISKTSSGEKHVKKYDKRGLLVEGDNEFGKPESYSYKLENNQITEVTLKSDTYGSGSGIVLKRSQYPSLDWEKFKLNRTKLDPLGEWLSQLAELEKIKCQSTSKILKEVMVRKNSCDSEGNWISVTFDNSATADRKITYFK